MKFLAIFASNLDEFFMVRVAGLREQAFGDMLPQDPPADGLKPLAQLQRIARRTEQLVAQQYACWNESIVPALAAAGIRIHAMKDLDAKVGKSLDKYFRQAVFPVLTPMAIDPAHPSPRFHNRGLYLAAMLERVSGIGPQRLFAVVQVPQVLPRFVSVEPDDKQNFVLLDDLIASRLPELFGGYRIVDHATFRLTRDMDVNLLEQEADDMLRSIESRLRARQRTEAVRLEISAGMNPAVLEDARQRRGAALRHERSAARRLQRGLRDQRPARHDVPVRAGAAGRSQGPARSAARAAAAGGSARTTTICSPKSPTTTSCCTIRTSRSCPVLDFIEQAARDPQVLAIKQTLYRTSGDSPIVRALAEAAENGKQVTALVELKARFDEANNITWARQLERAGVHVVFGFMGLKTHCKLAMVVRKEGKKVRRYVHLSTGNYNPEHGAGLHRPRPVHRRQGDRRRRLGAVQFPDRLFAEARVAEAGDRAERSQAADDRADRRAGRAGPRGQAVADHRQAQLAGRPPDDRGAVPGQPGRRADRPHDPRHLLPAAGTAGHLGEHPRVQHRRPLPRAQPDPGVRRRRRRSRCSSAVPTGCRGTSSAASR